jgi:hypothetical protein
MVKIHKWVHVLAVVLVCGTAQSAPPRILVQTPYSDVGWQLGRDRAGRASQTLAHYLYEWLGEAPDARLVDESQARNVLGAVNNVALTQRPEDICRAVCTIISVDAVILWEWRDGELMVRLHRAAGVTPHAVPYASAADAGEALATLTDWLAAELGVSARSSPLAGDLARDVPGMIEDLYIWLRLYYVWEGNSGETQLATYRAYLGRLPQDIRVAATIAYAGIRLSLDAYRPEKPAACITTLLQALPCLLGTVKEPLARRFCEVNRHQPQDIEKELLAMIRRVGQDEVESVVEDVENSPDKVDGIDADSGHDAASGVQATLGGPRSPAQQAGALRCLGAMKSKTALTELGRTAKAKDVIFRRATAWALAQYAAPAGMAALETLSRDADATTAFLAAWALSHRGQAPADLAARALACLKDSPDCEEAWEALSAAGTTAEAVEPLRQALSDHRPGRRLLAVEGLLRLGALDAEGVRTALDDPAAAVLMSAVVRLPATALDAQRERLVALANHPDDLIAEAARERLAAVRPAEPRAIRQFELAIEHLYIRKQLIEDLARDPSAEALADLEAATANADPHARALAITRLSERDPGRARGPALRLLTDTHRWVRLHAAAVAARMAATDDAAALQKAREAESDEATRLYLDDAIARAEGHPLPPPRPPANRVGTDKAQPVLCGHGRDCVGSPIQGYYDLAYNPDEPARKAHAAGKVFLARANKTARNPVKVCLSRGMRDGFWLALDEEFGDLAALDGVVLGEESMYFGRGDGWQEGWRLFCREAGIDARRVAGDCEKLSAIEKQAWWNWEQRVAIDGFNAMYDWIKLCYGKRRPGFQVCTFMPCQNGPCDFDRQWKFDIGAGYYYETNNRHRYTQIRRLKTVWPDRPVLWLYDGAPMGLHGPGLNYQLKPLTWPLQNPSMPQYADALCSWLAGAHPGCFYARLGVDRRNMKAGAKAAGVWVFLEGITPSSLEPALDNVYRGVEEFYRTEAETKTAGERHAAGEVPTGDQPASDLAVGGSAAREGADVASEFEEHDPNKDPFHLRVKAQREAVRLGIILEQQLVFDAARLLAGLPMPATPNDVLLVGDEGATSGALRLPQRYDYLDHVNKLAGADVSRYRFIGVANSDQVLLCDPAIHAVSAWLKDTPGLLYVRKWLPASPTTEAATVADLDGHLEAEWPWARDVALADKAYRVTGDSAKALSIGAPGTVVLWQGNGFKGAVLFDRSALTPEELREAINKLHAERHVGVAFSGPVGMERADLPGVVAAAACWSAPTGELTLPGVDLLTGIVNPVLRKARGATFVAHEHRGKYAAAYGGIAVLCQNPIVELKPLDDGLEIDSGGGLIQAVSAHGAVDVRAGVELPEIAAVKVLTWMLLSRDPGLARVMREQPGGIVTYLRAPGKVTLRRRQDDAGKGARG